MSVSDVDEHCAFTSDGAPSTYDWFQPVQVRFPPCGYCGRPGEPHGNCEGCGAPKWVKSREVKPL